MKYNRMHATRRGIVYAHSKTNSKRMEPSKTLEDDPLNTNLTENFKKENSQDI